MTSQTTRHRSVRAATPAIETRPTFAARAIDPHDLCRVATDGGINGLRPWCDANPLCVGYAVEEDVQQVWFKAAAALDYHGMDPSFCPQGGLPPPAGTGNCPYGPHTGKGVTDAGGLYIKCQVSTAACQRSFLAGLFRLSRRLCCRTRRSRASSAPARQGSTNASRAAAQAATAQPSLRSSCAWSSARHRHRRRRGRRHPRLTTTSLTSGSRW